MENSPCVRGTSSQSPSRRGRSPLATSAHVGVKNPIPINWSRLELALRGSLLVGQPKHVATLNDDWVAGLTMEAVSPTGPTCC